MVEGGSWRWLVEVEVEVVLLPGTRGGGEGGREAVVVVVQCPD